MSRNRVLLITLGMMLSLFMASMESTVVSTAMPTIASQLGGLELYSWVFSAYMLTSTTTVPIYGKLSDLYGRQPVFGAAMALFLIGSILCGRATSMTQLIAFRALQGLGAGGVLPLVFIIIGDLFSLEQRARMQGLFSGVWGVSSVVGPLLGGFLVDKVNWSWVFYVNVIPGLIAWALVTGAWRGQPASSRKERMPVDYPGAALLSISVVILLLGLAELGTTLSWVLLGAGVVLLVVLAWVESRAADPILPLALFRERLFAVSCLHGVLAGWAMFGSASFVPLFVQSVLGTSATAAGATLTPQLIAWVLASIIGSRLLLRVGYRTLALVGMSLLVLGMFLLSRLSLQTSQIEIMVYLALTGLGMGLSIPAFLIAVQSSVRREQLGTATSTVQFSRSIGGTVGVSVMGVVLSIGLTSRLMAAGLDPGALSVDSLLNPPGSGAATSAVVEGALRTALAGAIGHIFFFAFLAAVLGLLVTAFAPEGRISQLVERRQEHAASLVE